MLLHPKDVDLVTITFEGDIRLTVLQILSVDRLLDHPNLGRYLVILNGQDNAEVEAFIRSSVESRISPELAAKIEYVEAASLMPGHDPLGWRGQQLLKLLVVNNLTAPYYLVLDAKNHFVHRTLMGDFFTETGIKTLRRGAPSSHEAWIKHAFAAFGIRSRVGEFEGAVMPTITPYVMVPELVREMMADLEARHGGRPFGGLFENEFSATTEFLLYWAFLVATDQDGLY